MKKLGAVTIGQAPRTDILEDISPILGTQLQLIQAGALDGMTLQQVEALRPDGSGTFLVSRMKDGTAVTLQEDKILPLMQQRITELETMGVSAILIMCTGEFPECFTASVPIVYPSKLICGMVGSLNNISSIGVITPDSSQTEDVKKKWGRIIPTVVPVIWNPYTEKLSETAAMQLKDAQVDIAVMDCFGYTHAMQSYAAEAIGKPVILSRTMVARVLLEIV